MLKTRTIEQVKIYKLLLNPMTANFEKVNIVAVGESEQQLRDWVESLKVEPYRDGTWLRSFEKGSPLEWYNPIDHSEYCGIEFEWTTIETLQNYIDQAKGSMGFDTIPEIIGTALKARLK